MNGLLTSLASLLAVLSSLLGLQQLRQAPASSLATTTLAIGNANIIVEIVDTDAARTRGLSGRATLGENRGMLFVFDTTTYQSFWMKDMSFPIDIIWLDDNWRVVDITQNILPPSTSLGTGNFFLKTYSPRAPARYVLEVNAGFIAAHKITIGEQIVQP